MQKFWLGFVTSQLLGKSAWALALSDSDFGVDVLKKALSRLDHDKLLRLQNQINLELVRRRRQP